MIQFCVLDTNQSKVVVDHEGGSVLPPRNRSSFWTLFLETDFLLELRIQDDLAMFF